MSLADVVSAFGAEAKRKLANLAATGAPEDQLRAPLEELIKGMAELCGQPVNAITAVGETTLAHLATRPDYSITRRNELVGLIGSIATQSPCALATNTHLALAIPMIGRDLC